MDSFKAFRIHEENKKIVARFEQLKLDDLAAGDVVVRVTHSDINFKDVLAATGAGKILRRYPLVGGIDFAGVVESSTDSRYSPGDPVLVTGSGLSETHDGGYAEFARVKGEWVIPMPPGWMRHSAMALGTAGFTAALAIHRMERNGQTPERGPIVVTGASGGVGSVAIDMLAGRGYEVVAVSGKGRRRVPEDARCENHPCPPGSGNRHSSPGVGPVCRRHRQRRRGHARVADPGRGFLGQHCEYRADGRAKLETTVMPFILRGISLIGINSAATLRPVRLEVWKRIATDLKPRHLDRIVTRTISFDDLPGAFAAYLDGSVTGRTVVKITE